MLQKALQRMQILRQGNSRFLTYRCSETSESMNWVAMAVPHSGRIMYAYQHAHKEYYHSQYLFAATPQQLGLAEMYNPKDWPDAPEYAYELEPHGSSINKATAQLFERLQQAQRECQSDAKCTREPQLLCAWRDPGREPPEAGQPPRRGAEWDRAGTYSKDCRPLYLVKGQVLTQVSWELPAAYHQGGTVFEKLFYIFLRKEMKTISPQSKTQNMFAENIPIKPPK